MHVAIAVLVLLGAAADPNPIDREKLLQSIRLPRGSVSCGYAVNNTGDIILFDDEVQQREKIAQAEKGLLGDPGNAARYRALANLYWQTKQSDNGDAALRKAAELYRPQVAARPDDGLLLTRYADCLLCNTPKDRDEVEKLLRRAARLAPNEWECWLNLAIILSQKGDDLLASIEANVRQEQQVARITAQVEQCFAEAQRCHDRSVSLAPREPRVYLARAGFRNHRASMSPTSQNQRGGDFGDRPFGLLTDCCADLWQAARLKPDDERVLGIAVVYQLTAGLSRQTGLGSGVIASLPEKSKAAVESAIARLEKLAAGTSSQSASASAILGLIYMYTHDDRMLARLHRAVQLNPALDQAWEMRIGALATGGKVEECLAACQERLKYNDTAHTHFLLAKAYEDAKRLDEAKPILEQALRADPDDVPCRLALAALQMRKDNPEDLAQAGRLLDKAAPQIRANPAEADVLNYAILGITFSALDGQLEAARHWLAGLSPKQRADERVKKLAELLEPKYPR